MDTSVKRVLMYIIVGVVFYGSAALFVQSQAVRVVLYGAGVLLIAVAEVSFWIHVVRLSLKRRRQ